MGLKSLAEKRGQKEPYDGKQGGGASHVLQRGIATNKYFSSGVGIDHAQRGPRDGGHQDAPFPSAKRINQPRVKHGELVGKGPSRHQRGATLLRGYHSLGK